MMATTKEMRALFAEERKIVGRPSTPNLDDDSIPCVGSVKHLINECREFEDPKFKSNQHLIEVLVENPTDDLGLINRSLEMLSHQDSVPEYDEIMGRDNMRALEVLEGGGNGDSEGEEGSWVEDGDAQSFGHGSFGGGSTLNTNSVGYQGYAMDGLSLASNSLQGSMKSAKSKGCEVTWKGRMFRSTESLRGGEYGEGVDGASLDGINMGIDISLGDEASFGVDAQNIDSINGGSIVSKKKRVKPRDFPKKLRKRGPFSMVGPRDVKVSLGLPPIQSAEQRKNIIKRYRSRKTNHDMLIETINTSDDQIERSEKVTSHTSSVEVVEHHNRAESGVYRENLIERQRSLRTLGNSGEEQGKGFLLHNHRKRTGGGRNTRKAVKKTPKELEKEKIQAMKGVEKLKYLVKDLEVEEETSYKELIPKVLNYRSPKRNGGSRSGSRGERRSAGRHGVLGRNRNFTTLRPHKEVVSQWEKMALDEVTEEERWLEGAIHNLRRQINEKQVRQEEQELVEEHIRRVSRKAKKGILKRHRQTVMTSPDRSFERTHTLDETLPHEVYQKKQDEVDEHREFVRIRRETAMVQRQSLRAGAGSPGGRSGSPVQFV